VNKRGKLTTIFCGILTVSLIGLKLIGYISWNWVWIISPLWLPVVVATLGVLLVILGWVHFT